eukprot:1088345-Prorocentrum_minimum.AAC.5
MGVRQGEMAGLDLMEEAEDAEGAPADSFSRQELLLDDLGSSQAVKLDAVISEPLSKVRSQRWEHRVLD